MAADVPAPDLSEGQLTALRNLSAKQGGSEVDWINIADARRLTELGLAERNREGWNITEDGVALLAAHEPQGRSTLSE